MSASISSGQVSIMNSRYERGVLYQGSQHEGGREELVALTTLVGHGGGAREEPYIYVYIRMYTYIYVDSQDVDL